MFTKFVDKNLFFKKEKESLRDGFGRGLVKAGEENEKVVAVCADLAESTRMSWFKERFPERFIETGIMEQHMAGLGSGLAAMGYIPFISSYAMFSPGRNWEQIRTTICYNNQNVKIVGSHAGVSVGPDGGTHQAIEDIAITRVIPNIEVVVPADSYEAELATKAIAKSKIPSYIRLARAETPKFLSKEVNFEMGKPYLLWDSPEPQVLFIASGPISYEALLAAVELEKQGVNSRVLNLNTIKPLSEELVFWAKEVELVVVVEEHQVHGGVFSAVCELFSQKSPKKIMPVAIMDQFGQSGDPEELIKHYGLEHSFITKKTLKYLKR